MNLLKYYKSTIILGLILLLSLMPANSAPKISVHIPHLDKIIHFIMYFSLTGMLLIDIKNNIKKPTRVLILSVLFSILVLSGIIEIIQEKYIFGRSGSWLDLLANCSGLIVAFLIIKLFRVSKQHQGL